MAVKTAPPPRHVQSHFLNRELGLLEFQRRVLAQAEDAAVPLLERLKFLCIVSSNLDEFFEIRVSGVKEQIKLGIPGAGPDGKTPREVFQAIGAHRPRARRAPVPAAERRDPARPRARRASSSCGAASSPPRRREWVRDYFLREMMPVLTPIGLDPAHPFPRVFNKSLNFAVELEGRDAFGRDARIAIVQAPRILPRIIKLPPELSNGHRTTFVFLTSILHEHVQELFAGMHVLGCYQFRVTRNSDLFVDEEDVKDLRRALQGELPQRHFGDAVRLEIADDCPPQMTEFLLQQFGLGAEDLYQVNGPVNLVRLMTVPNEVDREDLLYPPFRPGFPAALAKRVDMMEAIRAGDVLLHHPLPVVRAGRPLHAGGGRGSERGGDQADRLPDRRRLGADGGADRRRAQRQGGHGGRRADGALRRGGQHQLGRAARGSRRPRRLRRGRPQDAREDGCWSCAARTASCGATCTSRTGNYHSAHRARRTPTSACSPATSRSAPT